MKHQISTSIVINAHPSVVWETFIAFDKYPEWNPFIKTISGELKVGQRFNAVIGTMKFKPTLKVLKPTRELTWLGRLWLPSVFDGRHSFELHENADGSTTFIQGEQFSGILVPLLKKKLNTTIIESFHEMNRSLKKRVEGK